MDILKPPNVDVLAHHVQAHIAASMASLKGSTTLTTPNTVNTSTHSE
jgi:hypothetical protein